MLLLIPQNVLGNILFVSLFYSLYCSKLAKGAILTVFIHLDLLILALISLLSLFLFLPDLSLTGQKWTASWTTATPQ